MPVSQIVYQRVSTSAAGGGVFIGYVVMDDGSQVKIDDFVGDVANAAVDLTLVPMVQQSVNIGVVAEPAVGAFAPSPPQNVQVGKPVPVLVGGV